MFNLDDYEPVAVRLARWLESTDGQPRVITHLVHYNEGRSCVFRAELWVGDILISTGWAEEHVEDRGVNKTSHLENAESSALGRALANAGLAGSDPTKRPSREEMQKAARSSSGAPTRPQEPRQGGGGASGRPATSSQLNTIRTMAAERDYQPMELEQLSAQDASDLITMLKSMPKAKKPALTVVEDEEPF